MKKLKKKYDYNKLAFELLKEILDEYFLTFSSLCNVKNSVKIKDFCDSCISRAYKIVKIKDNYIEKNKRIKALKLDIVSFITYIGNTVVKNKKSLNNFLMILNIYDLIRNYASVEKDDFRKDLIENQILLKSINSLSELNNVKIQHLIDINEVILPEEITEDFNKIISLLKSSLKKHLIYLFDFVNDNQLFKELKSTVIDNGQKIVEENKNYNLEPIKEDYAFYIAIKSRLLGLNFDLNEYITEANNDKIEEVKKDLKTFKSNNTKITNLLKRYEKLLLEGE